MEIQGHTLSSRREQCIQSRYHGLASFQTILQDNQPSNKRQAETYAFQIRELDLQKVIQNFTTRQQFMYPFLFLMVDLK